MPYADPEKRREYAKHASRAYRKRNPDKIHIANKRYQGSIKSDAVLKQKQDDQYKKYYAENRNTRLVTAWVSHLKRNYGLTTEIYDTMAIGQEHACAICRSRDPGPGKSRLSVDHDHQTGRVRGLLCGWCNPGLGHFKESVEILSKAVSYLIVDRSDYPSVAQVRTAATRNRLYRSLRSAQGGRCAICQADTPGLKRDKFSVDHAHSSGVIRGLLCGRCNFGLGEFKDNPEILSKAISYLTSRGAR